MDNLGKYLLSRCVSEINSGEVREISTLLSKPVDLPCENPTKAYWQHPPHDIAQHQSHELPSSCDFLVIGSGMTGLAAAKYLLETNDEARIVVLEARAICSGATGRNGGHLKSSAVLDFAANTERFGEEQARKIQAYQSMTCARVRQVAEQYCAMESEIRQVNSIGVFEDSELMKHALCTIDQFRGGENKDSTDYGVVNAQVCKSLLKAFAITDYLGIWYSRGCRRNLIFSWSNVAVSFGYKCLGGVAESTSYTTFSRSLHARDVCQDSTQ